MAEKQYILVGSALFNWSETQRMIEIADALQDRGYTIVFLGEGKYDYLLEGKGYIREQIEYDAQWYSPKRISMMLDMDQHGSNFAAPEEIEQIIAGELEVIQTYKPLAILTGYRMTLTISARLCRIPIVWSLAATLSKPYLAAVAEKAAQAGKTKGTPKLPYEEIRALFEDKIACERLLGKCKTSGAWNQFLLRKACTPMDCDLDIYTGDLNLMSDAGTLFPQLKETERYKFIGPILNNQPIAMPASVKKAILPENSRKKVLISIGSGGKKELFTKILRATRGFDCDFFISVVGILQEDEIRDYPENYYFCDKFPLIDIAQCCDAAIIQGGQGTLYAMLAARCPFVSIPATFEQRQNVENLFRHYKCGALIRMFSVTEKEIRSALTDLLSSEGYKEQALCAANAVGEYFDDRRLAPRKAADYIEALISKQGRCTPGE